MRAPPAPKKKIKLSIIAITTFILSFSIIVLGVSAYYSTKNQITRDVIESFTNILEKAYSTINEIHTKRLSDLAEVSKNPSFINSIINITSQEFDPLAIQQARNTINQSLTNKNIEIYALFDENFILRSQNSTIINLRFVESIREKLRSTHFDGNNIHYLNIYRTPATLTEHGNTPYFIYASKIYLPNADKTIYLIVAMETETTFSNWVPELVSQYHGELLFFNNDYSLISKSYHYNEISKLDILNERRRSVENLNLASSDEENFYSKNLSSLNVDDSTSHRYFITPYTSYHGMEVLGASTIYAPLNIGILTEIHAKIPYQQLELFKESLIYYSGITILLILVFSLFYRRLVDELAHRLQDSTAIFESTNEGMIIFNALSGSIIKKNKAAIKSLELESEKNITEIFGEVLVDGILDRAASDCSNTFQAAFTAFHSINNQKDIVLEIFVSPLPQKSSKIKPALITFRDISVQFNYDLEMQEQKEKAEIASQAKSNFMATISHELRTPLHTIIGMLEALISTSLTESQRYYAKMSQDSADSLLEIIDNILDFIKIEDNNYELSEASVSLRSIVDRIEKRLTDKLNKNNNRISILLDPNYSDHIKTDPERLSQCMFILIDNANKFTKNGEVSVSTEILKNDDTYTCLIRVSDTGIGIPEDKLTAIFESFQQVDTTIMRHYGGIGLGLSLLKGLINQLGGDVQVESILGHGTTFCISIPCKILNQQEIDTYDAEFTKSTTNLSPEEQDTVDLKKLKGIHVLAAEDNEINQEMLSILLSKMQIKFNIFNNGLDLLTYLEASNSRCDLILMDCHMPIMDGFTTTAQIRQLPSPLCDIPIIAITADALIGDRERCLKSGMTDYISKPVKRNDLRAILIKNLLGHDGVEINEQQVDWMTNGFSPEEADELFGLNDDFREETDATQDFTSAHFDPEVLINEIGDMDISLSLFQRFIDTLEADISDLSSLVVLNQLSEAKKAAHKIKGGARMIGCSLFADLLQNLEHACRDESSQHALNLIADIETLSRNVKDDIILFINAHRKDITFGG